MTTETIRQSAMDVTVAVLGVLRRWKREGAAYTGDIARGVRQPVARVRRVLEALERRGEVRRVVVGNPTSWEIVDGRTP